MKVFIRAEDILKAAKELQAGFDKKQEWASGYVFDVEPQEELASEIRLTPVFKVPAFYYATRDGAKIRVSAVVCSQCGHENWMGTE